MSRRNTLLILAAVIAAFAISLYWKPVSYVEQLVRIQAEQELGHIDKSILNEPFEVQATLLDYSGDQELVFKTWIALSKYQGVAQEILLLYGSEPEFKEILRKHGESVIPVIQYFRENDVWSVRAMDSIGKASQSVADAAKWIWNGVFGHERTNSDPAAQPDALSPTDRGWYAVNFIKHEGHHFLGQFAVNSEQKAKWNQVDRIVKGSTSLFTSGMRDLETKHDLGEDITTADVFWAGLDVAVLAVPAKLLTSGKAVARSGKELSFTARTRLFGPQLLLKKPIFQKLGKYGAVAATIYIVATHPSLLSSVFAWVAEFMGISVWLVQFVGWSIVIAFALYVLAWLLKPAAIFLRWGGTFILWGLGWLEHSRKKINPKHSPTPTPSSVSGDADGRAVPSAAG